MDKRKNKIFLKRAFSLMLSAVVLFTGLPLEMLAAPQSMDSKVADEDVLLLQNDSISVRMSGKNGGFYISNVEGDKTIKSDNNKDKIVAVRLTEEEHQRLTMYAKKHSLKISDVLKNGLYEVLNKPVNK